MYYFCFGKLFQISGIERRSMLPVALARLARVSRKWIIVVKGEAWFKEKFLHVLTPVTIVALLVTLIFLFSFKGEVILARPLTIL